MKISAEMQQWANSIGLRFGRALDDKFQIAKPVEFIDAQPNQYIEPAITMRTSDAQLLMDELWRIGLRPSEGTGSAGALAAVQYHLEDMRRLVFKENP